MDFLSQATSPIIPWQYSSMAPPASAIVKASSLHYITLEPISNSIQNNFLLMLFIEKFLP